jgi:AraC-like DNA-binding protein
MSTVPDAGVRAVRGLSQPLHLVVHAQRDKVRGVAQRLPRRRVHVTLVRDATEARIALRERLVDAVLIDLGGGDPAWEIAALASEVPSAPFYGVMPWRTAEAWALAKGVGMELADILADGVDDAAVLDLVALRAFTPHFGRVFAEPPAALGLERDVQRAAWRGVVAAAGRPVRTAQLADALGVTREHLSRVFSAGYGPNLKRVIDLVRLCAAAVLAKNPGYDTADVARVLGFASASHLATTTQRVLGLKPTSLARLRPGDLVEHFVKGHSRSRG